MAIGVYWWRRRPAGRFGPLLVGFGILTWLVSWQAAERPLMFDIGVLAAKGSLFLTRPSLVAYTGQRDDLVRAAADLFSVVGSGAVQIRVNQTFPLADAAAAHKALEARRTTGSTVLLP